MLKCCECAGGYRYSRSRRVSAHTWLRTKIGAMVLVRSLALDRAREATPLVTDVIMFEFCIAQKRFEWLASTRWKLSQVTRRSAGRHISTFLRAFHASRSSRKRHKCTYMPARSVIQREWPELGRVRTSGQAHTVVCNGIHTLPRCSFFHEHTCGRACPSPNSLPPVFQRRLLPTKRIAAARL